MASHLIAPNDATDADVAIVGYGPTGAVLANLLGARGWRVAIFDREPGLLDLPRAVHFDGEVMRIFHGAGLAPTISALIRPSGGMQYINPAGDLMLERKAALNTGVHGWANNYLFHQPDLENALRNGIKRFGNVRELTRHDVKAVTQTACCATLTVNAIDDKTTRAFSARWVVGCDGARSIIRGAISSGYSDLGHNQSWLVVDILLKHDLDLPIATVQFCDPTRPITYVNVTGQRRRWEFMLMPGDDAQAITESKNVWRLLSRWITPNDGNIVRSAVYTFHSRVADRWRHGRLLIAGDSAHQMPPFLGQGMCAGIRDAANLAWKLDLVLKGADPELLNTYQSERQPHVQQYVNTAVKLGNIIQTTDVIVAAQRDIDFAQMGTQEIVNLSPCLGTGVHTGVAPAGTIPGQPRLHDGPLLDEVLGSGFSVVSGNHLLTQSISLDTRHAFDALGTRWVVNAGLAAWLEELDTQVVVFRPDRYIFGTANTVEGLAQLAMLLPKLPEFPGRSSLAPEFASTN